MSTLAKLGEELTHEGARCIVQRIVQSSTLFEDETECYILEETYAQIQTEHGALKFIVFSTQKHSFTKTSKLKGLDVKTWKRF